MLRADLEFLTMRKFHCAVSVYTLRNTQAPCLIHEQNSLASIANSYRPHLHPNDFTALVHRDVTVAEYVKEQPVTQFRDPDASQILCQTHARG